MLPNMAAEIRRRSDKSKNMIPRCNLEHIDCISKLISQSAPRHCIYRITLLSQ